MLLIYTVASLVYFFTRTKIVVKCDPTYYNLLDTAKSWNHLYTSEPRDNVEQNIYDYNAWHYAFLFNKNHKDVRTMVEKLCPKPPWTVDGPDSEGLDYWSEENIPPIFTFSAPIQLGANLDVNFFPGKWSSEESVAGIEPGTEEEWTTVFVGHYVPAKVAEQ